MKSDVQTAQAFADSWNHLPKGSVYTREQFEDWMYPIIYKDVQGKTVLELGCGNASLMVHMAEWKPSYLEGVDLGDSVTTAELNTAHLEHVSVVRGDLVTYTASKPFDLVYCIGVLHHLQEPQKGFESVLRNTKPGGAFHCWVYAWEGNAVVRWVIDPIRRLTSILPWWFTKYCVATPLAAVFFVYAKVIRLCACFRWVHACPMYEYAYWIAQRGFDFFQHVAFDQLVTPQTTYIRRDTINRWLTSSTNIDQNTVYITKRNGNSWKFGGKVLG